MAHWGYDDYDNYAGFDESCGMGGDFWHEEYIDGQHQSESDASYFIRRLLDDNPVMVFSFSYCGPCKKTKALLNSNRVPYMALDVDTDPYITKQQYMEALEPLSGIRSVPQVFINGQFFGGSRETRIGLERGQVQRMIRQTSGYDASAVVQKLLQQNDIVLFTYTYCPPCNRTKALLDQQGIHYLAYNLDTDPNITQSQYADALEPLSGIRTVPQMFIHGKFYGDSVKIREGFGPGPAEADCAAAAVATVRQLLRENEVIMFSNSICNYSRRAKRLLEDNDVPYMVHYVDTDPFIEKKQYQNALEQLSGIRTLPQLFIRGRFYGDSQKTRRGVETGEIQELCT